MNKILLFLCLSIFILSCGEENPLSDYTYMKEGIHYKMHVSNDGVQPENEDVAIFNLVVRKADSIITSTYKVGEPAERFISNSQKEVIPVMEVLRLMSEGDSATIAVEVDSLQKMPDNFQAGDIMYMDVNMLKVDYKTNRADRKAKELGAMTYSDKGFYYKKKIEKTGTTPKPGEQVNCYIEIKKGNKVLQKTGDKGLPEDILIPENGQFTTPVHDALKMMSVGEKMKVAFAVNKLPQQPKDFFPDELMVFEVELYDIKDKATVVAEAKALKQKAATMDAVMQQRIKSYKTGGMRFEELETGLKYYIHEEGVGEPMRKGQRVKVHYAGYLLEDATKFDSSFDKNMAYSFTLGKGEVIKGWDEGVQLLKKGSSATFIIPPHLAYGEQGISGAIPPNSQLVFYVEVK